MIHESEIKSILGHLQSCQEKEVIFDQKAITAAYEQERGRQSLAVKILSVFGGIMASLTFLGFLFIAGIYNSGPSLLFFGGVLIAGSIWLGKEYYKILFHTMSVSSFICGFILLALGFIEQHFHVNSICILFILLALGSLVVVQSYIQIFVALLIAGGSVLTLIIINNAYEFTNLYVVVLVVSIAYMFHKEAKLILSHKWIARLYAPLKIGLIFNCISGFILLTIHSGIAVYLLLTSAVNIALILFQISRILVLFHPVAIKTKVLIYTLSLLVLLPTMIFPAISGSILLLLLSFWVNYKTGFVISVISSFYFICHYYYDLNFSLLTKSLFLFASGIFFLALYVFTQKKMSVEKV